MAAATPAGRPHSTSWATTRPPLLHVRGARSISELCEEPAVAVVGARRGSRSGEEFAFALARGLAAAGVAVISGLALGIDAAAHAGALAAGGRTVGVLGCGIDRVYPRQNTTLALRVVASGALVSEWGEGVEPAPWRFPVRNRLIAALASVTVVVEATRRSGALITADHALALGRDVLAVPGSAWSPLGRGRQRAAARGCDARDLARGRARRTRALGAGNRASKRAAGCCARRPGRRGGAGLARAPRRAIDARRSRPPARTGRSRACTCAGVLELDGLLAREPDGRLVALSGVGTR